MTKPQMSYSQLLQTIHVTGELMQDEMGQNFNKKKRHKSIPKDSTVTKVYVKVRAQQHGADDNSMWQFLKSILKSLEKAWKHLQDEGDKHSLTIKQNCNSKHATAKEN